MAIYKPKLDDLHKGPSKLLSFFFLVDISKSMQEDRKINVVNKTFIDMIPVLKQIQIESISEFVLKISIMTFDQTAKWIVAPTPIMEYKHDDFICSEHVANLSNAFNKLGEKLTRKEYMAHTGKIAEPCIMLITDSEPTPDDNYQLALNELLENGWFKNSKRFAVLIGADAINSQRIRDAVKWFVKNPVEGIISYEYMIPKLINHICRPAPHFEHRFEFANKQSIHETDESCKCVDFFNLNEFDKAHFSGINYDNNSFI